MWEAETEHGPFRFLDKLEGPALILELMAIAPGRYGPEPAMEAPAAFSNEDAALDLVLSFYPTATVTGYEPKDPDPGVIH